MRRVDVLPQIVRLDEVPRVETRWWAGPLTAATLPQASASLALLRLSLARICGDAGRYRYFGRATQSQQRQTVGSMSQIGGFQGQVRAAARLVAEHYSATAHIELRGATADRMRRSGGAERAASGGSGTFAGVGAINHLYFRCEILESHTHTQSRLSSEFSLYRGTWPWTDRLQTFEASHAMSHHQTSNISQRCSAHL